MSDSSKRQYQSLLLARPLDNFDVDDDSDEQVSDTKEELSLRSKLMRCSFKMILVCRDVLLVVVLLTFTGLTKESPKVTKGPLAYPFFPKDSVVKDWYKGQISIAIEEARHADIAFVMFYAPWDAESQDVRVPFEQTAKIMEDRVSFAAVNCWQPGSECRNQYSKVYNWPVLIAYPSHTRGVQYNGPHDVYHYVRFLNAVSRPLIRVTDHLEFENLLANHDAVILSSVSAWPGSHDYAILYITALRFLERDPFQEIAFAYRSHSIGANDGMNRLELHLWNETWIYPDENEWQSDAILSWILSKLNQVTMWFSPAGTKSMQLSAYIQSGPSLILFTPRNILSPLVDYYSLLREIGLEYYNCDVNLRTKTTKLTVRRNRLANYLNHLNLLQKCSKQAQQKQTVIPVTVAPSAWKRWSNETYCSAVQKLNSFESSQDCFSKLESACVVKEQTIFDNEDDRSPKELQKSWDKDRCRLFVLSQEHHPDVFSVTTKDSAVWTKTFNNNFSIDGLACKANISLTLISMDSLLHNHIAERLGVNLSTKKGKTAAVIINEKSEIHHIMKDDVNDESLRYFINDFHRNVLERALDSSTTLDRRTSQKINQSEMEVQELNTKSFFPVVMEPKKVVLVLYYSKQCFFCQGVSYIYLSTAKLLSSLDFIRFTRIDGDSNLLPWQFTMETYPTILLFPGEEKSESRAYPRSMPITMKNLVNFIIVNVDNNLKLKVIWSICSQAKFADDEQSCIKTLRMEILNLIDLNLRLWRKADARQKLVVLHQLQYLRNLHLLLAHSNKRSGIESYLNKLNTASNQRLVIEMK